MVDFVKLILEYVPKIYKFITVFGKKQENVKIWVLYNGSCRVVFLPTEIRKIPFSTEKEAIDFCNKNKHNIVAVIKM